MMEFLLQHPGHPVYLIYTGLVVLIDHRLWTAADFSTACTFATGFLTPIPEHVWDTYKTKAAVKITA